VDDGRRAGAPLTAALDVCSIDELPPGTVRIVHAGDLAIGVFNADGELYAIEDRCSHDDGPLAEGEFDPDTCIVVCPRHGAEFDVRTGRPRTLPAYLPVATYPVRLVDHRVVLELPG
jgi:3-phenylpropionate/trans-cinnamate dioxygenase ferredoxin subunit